VRFLGAERTELFDEPDSVSDAANHAEPVLARVFDPSPFLFPVRNHSVLPFP